MIDTATNQRSASMINKYEDDVIRHMLKLDNFANLSSLILSWLWLESLLMGGPNDGQFVP